MTKADLVEKVTASIARTAGPMISKKDCARVVDAFLGAIKDSLAAQESATEDANGAQSPNW
jgi:integration host factor subunit beta